MIKPISVLSIQHYNFANKSKYQITDISDKANRPINNRLPASTSFKANFLPYINPPRNTSSIQLHSSLDFKFDNDRNLEPSNFTKLALKHIFKVDRDLLEKNYWYDETEFSRFSKLGYIEKLLSNDSEILKYVEKQNERKISQEYSYFFDNTLKSLENVARGDYEYNNLFFNKKIGDKNLVDFWLVNLTPNEKIQDKNKIERLNNLLKKEYSKNKNIDSLANITILEYFKTKLSSNNSNKIPEFISRNSDISNLSKIKNVFLDITNADNETQTNLFKDLVQNKTIMSHEIDNIKIKDLLLLPIVTDIDEIKYMSDSIKNDILDEIIGDKTLLKSSIDNVLTAIRKEIILSKTKEAKKSQIQTILSSKELENFDKKLLQELFDKNKKERADKILSDIKLFEKKANSLFFDTIVAEPFTTKANNELVNTSINMILSIVNNALMSTTYDKKANDILSKLSELSKTLYVDKDMHKANCIWKELVKFANNEWSKNLLPALIKRKQQDYLLVENFLNQNLSQDLKNTGVLSTVFDSDVISIEEKAFLAKNSNTKEFVSFCKFLSEHVPGNNERKHILNRLIEKDSFYISLFEELKETFISDIRNKDYNGLTINNTILFNDTEKSFCDLVLTQFGKNEKINRFSDIKSKVDYLNNFTDEDLATAFDNLKVEYLKNKFAYNSHLEIIKYDMSAQIDNLLNKLEVDIDGQKVNLFHFIDKYIQKLDNKIDKDNAQIKLKLDNLTNDLRTNNKLTRETQQVLMILLDRMERAYPNNKEFINSLRSDSERLFTGVLKGVPNIVSASLIAGISGNGLYLLTAIFPVLMSIGNEFKQGGLL